MLVATRTFRAADGSTIREGVSRVSEDHELAGAHPAAFVEATDGPPNGLPRDIALRAYLGAGLDVADRGGLTEGERAAMDRRVDELDRDARRRETRRYERPDTRRERTWWATTESLLDSLQPADPHDPLFEDIDELVGEQDEALLDEIDQAWQN